MLLSKNRIFVAAFYFSLDVDCRWIDVCLPAIWSQSEVVCSRQRQRNCMSFWLMLQRSTTLNILYHAGNHLILIPSEPMQSNVTSDFFCLFVLFTERFGGVRRFDWIYQSPQCHFLFICHLPGPMGAFTWSREDKVANRKMKRSEDHQTVNEDNIDSIAMNDAKRTFTEQDRSNITTLIETKVNDVYWRNCAH